MGIRAQQFYSRLDFRDETRVLAVLASLQGCHFMVTISGLSVALQLLGQAVLAALQGCHPIITASGLSVAHQLLVTLSPYKSP